LRPGEKLYEELLIGSNVTETPHPLIQRAQEAEFEWAVLKPMLQQLDDACARFDHSTIRLLLQKIVREYTPSTDIADNLYTRADPVAPRACAELSAPILLTPAELAPAMQLAPADSVAAHASA
jgi:hypothetical protein